MCDLEIVIRNKAVNIKVTGYSPPTLAILSGLYGDSVPADPGYVEWEANTGNYLLDYYINNESDVIRESIEKQLMKVLEANNE